MVVDFDSTYLSSNLRTGDSGTLNLVIKNTGGYRAENVEVWIPSTSSINVNKRLYVGRMEPSSSKTIPLTIRVEEGAKTGPNALQAYISYDGFDAEGRRDNNQLTTWEIPVRIYGDPLFQVSPQKTTYFKDTIDELKLDGLTMDSVKDLETTLTSSCVTVMGSSKQYVGALAAKQPFNTSYQMKPSTAGACTTSVILSYTNKDGTKSTENITIGLNVEDAAVDFKVASIDYKPTGPGQTVNVKIGLENVGKGDAHDITLSLSLEDPFVPVNTPEKYYKTAASGEVIEADFSIAVGWDAETKVYRIPLLIDYKVGGSSYRINKTIGLDVSGNVILEVIKVDASGSSVKVDVANLGSHTAEGIKATLIADVGSSIVQSDSGDQTTSSEGATRQRGMGLIPGIPGVGGQNRATSTETGEETGTQTRQEIVNQSQLQEYVAYKSDIKPSKQTTFTFDVTMSGPATLVLEYNGPNNERVSQRERIMLNGQTTTRLTGLTSARSQSGLSITTMLTYGAALLALGLIARWLYRKRKTGKK